MDLAVKNLLVLAKQYKGIIELIPFFEEITSLENYKSELVTQVSLIEKQKAEVTESFEARKKFYEDELKAALEEIGKANDELVHVKANNKALAKSMVDNAKAKADDIVAKAEVAKVAVEEATAEKTKLLADLSNEYEALAVKTKALKDQFIELRTKLDI